MLTIRIGGVLVVAAVALWNLATGDDAPKDDRGRLERELSRAHKCPGEPPPPVTCKSRSGGFDCDIDGSKVRVEDLDHTEVSKIC